MANDEHLPESGRKTNQHLPIDILLVEQDSREALRVHVALKEASVPGIRLTHADSLGRALKALADRPFGAVLLNLSLPDSSGAKTVDGVVRAAGDVPILALTDHHNEAAGREAIHRGAEDYRIKSVDLYRAMPRIVRDVVERRRLKAANAKLRRSQGDAELLLSKVLSVVEVGVTIVGSDGQLLVVNPTFGEMTGWSVGELAGQNVSQVFADGWPVWKRIVLEDAKRVGGEYQEDGVRMVRKGGHAFKVRLRSAEVSLAHDQTYYVVAYYGTEAKPSKPLPGVIATIPSAAFQSDIRKILGDDGREVSAGRLQIIGLESVRNSLGDRWEKVAERVRRLAQRTIESRLTPDDTFTRTQSGEFLICFGRLSEEEAWLKATSISEEIRRKLLGDVDGEQSTTATLSEEQVERLADVSVDTHRLRVSPSEVAETSDLANLFVAKLKAAAQEIRGQAQMILREMQESAQVHLREVFKKPGQTAPFVVQDFDVKTLLKADHLLHAVEDMSAFLADLDFMTLGKTAEFLHRGISARSPRVVVGVHGTTLTNGHSLEKYLGICEALTQPIRRSIIFKVKEVPKRMAPSQLRAILDRLSPFSSFQMIDLSTGLGRSLELGGTEVRIYSIDYGHAQSTSQGRGSPIQELAERVDQRKAYLLVDRVPKRLDPSTLYRHGVAFVAFDHRR